MDMREDACRCMHIARCIVAAAASDAVGAEPTLKSRNSIFSSAPYTLVPSTLSLPIRDPVSLCPPFEWLGKSNNLFKL